MKTIIPLLIVAALICGCKPKPTNLIQAITDEPLHGVISVETARHMVGNFTNRSVYKINKGDGLQSDDSRCVWFSLSQLKALINKIDSEKGDGVRFYFAAYDKLVKNGLKMNKDYLDYSTLVMVSTRDSSGLHFDYYNNKGKRGVIITADPENQGELCPPPANCNGIGATLLP